MKKLIFSTCLIFLCLASVAKKVKFAVDLSNETVSLNGVHITGDFQTLAGFPGGDWASNTTPLSQEGLTNIYSIVVDIPAFAKYEYKFVNGDQFYEAEFVPVQSRVGYNFDDNRWIYVDSLSDDTSFVGAIIFAGNAPAGLKLVRYMVDMQNQSVPVTGAHIAGDFQGWDPATIKLYSFGSGIYEIIFYVIAGTYEYKFYNGNTTGDAEIIPAGCAVNNNRYLQLTTDSVLSTVCFSLCTVCSLSGIDTHTAMHAPSLAPNPSSYYTVLNFNDDMLVHTIQIFDVTGRILRSYQDYSGTSLLIDKEQLDPGAYIITSVTGNDITNFKLIFE
jgi:hypothetical protein